MIDSERELTPKQKRFAELYADYRNAQYYGNATQCVLASYDISDDADKENTAAVMGNELLRIPKVSQYIKELQHQQVENIDADYIVSEIARLKEKAENAGNMPAALKAVEMLGKWKALFTERQITQNETLEDLVMQSHSGEKSETPAPTRINAP